MNKLWSYLRKLVISDSKESSKRFIFLFCIITILAPLTYIHTNKDNFTLVLIEWLGFCSFLVGGAIYQTIKNK